MPTIKESELGQEPNSCSNCPDYEGAIFLCGEGFLCERCFAELAGVDEADVFENFDDVPVDQKEKVRAKLALVRTDG